MDCKDVHKDLIFYLEGSLNKEAREQIEEHLHDCNECAGFTMMLKGSLSVISREKSSVPGQGFADRVLSAVNNSSKRSLMPSVFTRHVAAAAIILGIFTGIGIGYFTSDKWYYSGSGLSAEEYYMNDMYQEPIESFFLINYDENE